MSQPRFTLTLTLTDNHRFDAPISMAIGVDREVRISSRAVDNMKTGRDLGISLVSFESAIEMMRVKEFRKDLFQQAAQMLAARMAERMEDAEGWHDASRIEPARTELRGKW